MLTVYEKEIAPGFRILLSGDKGHKLIDATYMEATFAGVMGDVLRMIETRRSPVHTDETLNIIDALLAAKRSLRNGREMTVTGGSHRDTSDSSA
jgi:hypothetical protein